eukprot:3428132-Rhodomonas_salina.2
MGATLTFKAFDRSCGARSRISWPTNMYVLPSSHASVCRCLEFTYVGSDVVQSVGSGVFPV